MAVARVDNGLEHLHSLARDHGAAQAPDQFFALARKHGAADHFDPSDVAADKFHGYQATAPIQHATPGKSRWVQWQVL
jgi:hypothetical protein